MSESEHSPELNVLRRLKLDRLEAAFKLRDLAALPDNRPEALKGDQEGQYSIGSTINGRSALSAWRGIPAIKRRDCSLPLGKTLFAITAIHSGEHLAEELKELGLSAAELARPLDVPANRVTEILNRRRAIRGNTALRLAHFFGTTAEF